MSKLAWAWKYPASLNHAASKLRETLRECSSHHNFPRGLHSELGYPLPLLQFKNVQVADHAEVLKLLAQSGEECIEIEERLEGTLFTVKNSEGLIRNRPLSPHGRLPISFRSGGLPWSS